MPDIKPITVQNNRSKKKAPFSETLLPIIAKIIYDIMVKSMPSAIPLIKPLLFLSTKNAPKKIERVLINWFTIFITLVDSNALLTISENISMPISNVIIDITTARKTSIKMFFISSFPIKKTPYLSIIRYLGGFNFMP